MKTTVFALVALAAGVAVGMIVTQREFSNEVVPVDVTPTSSGGRVASKAKIGPKVTIVNGERHDFGTMDRNAHGEHTWIIRNDGDAPLTLSTGQASCTLCIKVFSVGKEVLQPAEKTEVKIEWDVKTSDAEFEQSGPLNTNDKNRPSVHLSLKGHVLDTVRADRLDVHFHDLSATESATSSVNIYGFRDEELKIESHDFSNPALAKHFEISFAPLATSDLTREPNAKSGQRMTLEVKPGLPQGDFSETITIATNQNSEPVKIRVIGNIASDVLLMGPNVTREKLLVSLGAISQNVGKKHTVFVLVKGPLREETKVQIGSVEPASEFSATLGEPIRDSVKIVRYPIVIEVPAGARPVTRMDAASARINVTTTHPEVKELNIKVRYVVKE